MAQLPLNCVSTCVFYFYLLSLFLRNQLRASRNETHTYSRTWEESETSDQYELKNRVSLMVSIWRLNELQSLFVFNWPIMYSISEYF